MKAFRKIWHSLGFLIFLISGCATTNLDVQRWKESHDIPRLIRALEDKQENRSIKREVVKALIEIGEPAVDELILLVERGNDDVSVYAAYVLGEIGPKAKKAVPALIRQFPIGYPPLGALMEKEFYEVRKEVVVSTYYPSVAGVPQKPEIYKREVTVVTFYAGAQALTKITSLTFGTDRKKWQEWWEKNKTK